MAGSQSKGKKGSAKSSRKRSSGRSGDRQPSEYAREAVAEWGKAARLAGTALSPLARRAAKRLIPAKTGDAGGAAGGLLSKIVPTNGNGSGGHLPVPIQEAIEIAVPVRVAYSLATRFEDYPEFSDHVEEVEGHGDTVAFEVKALTGPHTVEVEILDRRPRERIEWQSAEGPEHSGIVSFHELAPRLTHLELSVEMEPEGIVGKLTRTAHLTERTIRSELHRFKAYAELWQDDEEPEREEAEDEEAGNEYEDEEPVEASEDDEEPEAEDDEDYEDEESDEDAEYEDEEPVEAYEDEEAERPVEAYPDVDPAPAR